MAPVVWRAMASLLVLRDQANAIAPARSRASDGLVGDLEHQQTTSDHNPHYVPGVGANIVTALDLTHDPAHGFDSYLFAEVLRVNRDPRIKYVISNGRIFSSYAVTTGGVTYPPFTWRPYSGPDPHTNHVHVSVLDAVVSDTRTPWNLEGFEDDMTPAQGYLQFVDANRMDALLRMKEHFTIPVYDNGGSHWNPRDEDNLLATAIKGIQTDVAALKDSIGDGSTGGGLTPAQALSLAQIESDVQALISGIGANAAAVAAGR